MLTNCLAACAHLSITVSEIERDICEKIVILSYPLAFDAPVRGVPVGISPSRLAWINYNGLATHHHQSELVGDVAVPLSVRQAVLF